MYGVTGQIFRDHFEAVSRQRGFAAHQRKAARAVMKCRTAACGGHVEECPSGHVRRIHYNSCKHRSCPMCGAVETEMWLRRQLARFPACDYHQVVFTIPHELSDLWRHNRRRFSHLLFRAAWRSLREFLADPRWLGALPGVLGALHTWDQALGTHVHLHFLVTAGGVDRHGQWKALPGQYLPYPPAIALKFQGKFLAFLHDGFEDGSLEAPSGMGVQQCHNLLNRVSRNAGCKWHVQVQPRYRHASGLLKYLARYLRGGPISERRIQSYDGERVTIRPKKRQDLEGGHSKRREPIHLSAEEFVRRFLEHVPPSRMHTVRSFGLFHPSHRGALNAVRVAFGQDLYTGVPELQWEDLCADVLGHDPHRCPVCGQRLRALLRVAPQRSPPRAKETAA